MELLQIASSVGLFYGIIQNCPVESFLFPIDIKHIAIDFEIVV